MGGDVLAAKNAKAGVAMAPDVARAPSPLQGVGAGVARAPSPLQQGRGGLATPVVGWMMTEKNPQKNPQKTTQKNDRGARIADEGINEGINEGIKPKDEGISESVYRVIASKNGISAPDVARIIGKSLATIERAVANLVAAGRVEHRGSKKTGGYFAKGAAR